MEAEKQTLIRFYTITSDFGNMIYTGSTKLTVDERFNKHQVEYNQWKKGKVNHIRSYDLFNKYDIENCNIKELASQLCTPQERNDIERQYIIKFKEDPNYKCVNIQMPGIVGRTVKEWKADNKDKIKQYRDDNKDKKSQKCICKQCGSKYRKVDKSRHEQSKKHIKFVININITNNITGNDATVNINQQKTELELLEEELNQL